VSDYKGGSESGDADTSLLFGNTAAWLRLHR